MKSRIEPGRECAPTEEELLLRLRDVPGTALLFGASDTGKTTLAHKLAASLAQHGVTVLVDSDVGQSSVGPPACLGACLVKGPLYHWNKAQRLHFVGNFSPPGHFLPMLGGLSRMVAWARAKGGVHVLVDTTGFVTGGAAVELKYHKVELIRPRHVILLEQSSELQPLFTCLHSRRNLKIHRLKAPGAVHKTEIEERSRNRQLSLESYFENSNSLTFPLISNIMANPHTWLENRQRDQLYHKLVGLLNCEGSTLAMGVISEIKPDKARMVVKAPLDSVEAVTHLRLGNARLERNSGPPMT